MSIYCLFLPENTELLSITLILIQSNYYYSVHHIMQIGFFFYSKYIYFCQESWSSDVEPEQSQQDYRKVCLKIEMCSMAERFKIDQTKWSRSSLATHNSQMTRMLALTRCCVNSNSSFSHANIYIVFEKVGALSDIVDNLYSQYFQMLWYFHIYWRKKKHIEISLINSILSINSSNFQCKLHTTSSIN